MDNLEEVTKFVSKNKVMAKKGIVCVDGRYSSKFSGMMARPGGNFRGIMVLLALRKKLKLSVGRIVDTAVNAVEQMGIDFDMHTDSHADPNNLTSIGCGHVGKAEDPKTAKMYGVDPEDVKKALIYLRIKLEDHGYYNMVKLEGEHKEKGVLVVTGTQYTINHSDKKGNMYFVYDKARDEVYSKLLFNNLGIKGLTFKDFSDYSQKQLDATLKNLAQGLPIYEVNLDFKKPQVKFVGTVS